MSSREPHSDPDAASRPDTVGSQEAFISRGDRLAWWGAFALVLLGTGLRLNHYLAAPSFWYDEAALILNILESGYLELIGPLKNMQAAPPLYLWELRALYVTFGCNEWSMRLPAVLGGIAMLVVCWPWARQTLKQPGSLVLLGLAATSLHGIEHADEVKPYSLDAMWTVVILFLGCRAVRPDASRSSGVGLLALAAVGPWLSFPSVFALFGVGIAGLIEAVRHRDVRLFVGLLVYGSLSAAACFLFWLCVGRHQHTQDLTVWWKSAFWDFSSPYAAVTWPALRLREMADYATTGWGIPFLLLLPFGIYTLLKRNATVVWIVSGMVGAAFLANVAGKYPLDGRVSYFLGPVFWLLSAAAFDLIYSWCQPRWRWLPVLVLLGVSSSDWLRTAQCTLHVETIGDFRGAHEYIHRHWRDGDLAWLFTSGVDRIYHRDDGLVTTDSCRWDEVQALPGRRLWIAAVPGAITVGKTHSEMQAHLNAAGWSKLDEQPFQGVDVLLYEYPAK